MEERHSQGAWDRQVHTATFKMDNQKEPNVEHMELCSVLCGKLEGRAIWERIYKCMCMVQSLGCSPETITALLIGYIPIQGLPWWLSW